MTNQFVTASAFIPWEDKALILQRAASESFLPNNWEQAGGKVEQFENPINAAIREVLEETGLQISVIRPYFVHDYKKSNDRHHIEIAFYCQLTASPKVTISDEHQAFKWVTAEEVANINSLTETMRKVITDGFAFKKILEGHK